MIHFGIGEASSLACAVCWAIAVIYFKRAGESLPPFALNYFKNLLSLLLLGLTVLLLRGPSWPGIPPRELAITLISGTLGIAVADTLYFQSLNAIGAARMGIAGTAYSPSVILFAALLLGERLGLAQWGGVLVTLAGIALVNYTRPSEKLDAAHLRRGALMGVASVAVMALGIVLVKPVLEHQDFLWVVTLRVAAGVVFMSVLMLARRQTAEIFASFKRVKNWKYILIGSLFGTYISMLFWLAGYKYASASIAAVLNELSAIFIVLMATFLLREPLSRRQALGSVIAMLGVLTVVIFRA